MLKHILPLVPPHKTYVEVFGGAAALLFALPDGGIQVYNDIDSAVVNVFRVVRDKEKLADLERLLRLTPFSREESKENFLTKNEKETDVERAAAWLHAVYTTFGGRTGTWSFAAEKTILSREISKGISPYLNMIDRLQEIATRLLSVQIEHDDFKTVIKRWDSPDTFFFLDPPYVLETWTENLYVNEMKMRDNMELIKLCTQMQGTALYCGYPHYVHRQLEEAGWERREFELRQMTNMIVSEDQKQRTEAIWIHPRILAQFQSLPSIQS